MRRVRLKSAVPTPQHEALLFFALSLDEQLYDLTDDSFKAPALNTFSRTVELQAVASASYSAGIAREALTPFIDELEWSIGTDPVLDTQQRALCKLHLTSIRENLGEPDRIVRGVSGLRTVLGDYFGSCIQKIRDTIEHRPNNKEDLSALAATFVVHAENLGFPRRHSYHVAQNALIRHLKYEERFDPTLLLDDFFAGFPKERVKYNCLFLGEGDFQRLPRLLEKFGISATVAAPEWGDLSSDQRAFMASRSERQLFLLFRGISARSPAQGHQIAAGLFEEFVGVVRFFEHKVSLTRTSLSLIQDSTTSRIYRVHDAPDPMHCWVTHTAAGEEEMLAFASVTHGRQLSDVAANRLRRTLRLHRSALLSNSAENQLIDLWAGLEGLVARPGRESQRLEFFAECLLPALILSYPEKLFLSAYRDLSRVAPRARAVAMRLPGEDSGFSKFVRLVLCSEHESAREEFIELLKPIPLLLNKVWRLSQAFKNRTSTQKTLRKHRQKIGWHLARIYYMRNSIMHSATAMPYLPTLVENLHVYVDTLVKALQRTATLSSERLTIDGALQYLAVWERYRLHSVTHQGGSNDDAPTDENVWEIVFGESMTLAPSRSKEPALHVAQ